MRYGGVSEQLIMHIGLIDVHWASVEKRRNSGESGNGDSKNDLSAMQCHYLVQRLGRQSVYDSRPTISLSFFVGMRGKRNMIDRQQQQQQKQAKNIKH